jgi:hypothetical protein
MTPQRSSYVRLAEPTNLTMTSNAVPGVVSPVGRGRIVIDDIASEPPFSGSDSSEATHRCGKYSVSVRVCFCGHAIRQDRLSDSRG